MRSPGLQADFFESGHGLRFCVFTPLATDQKGHHYVLKRREFSKKGVNLPHETQFPVAELGQVIRR